jgi:hypothetical protein
MNDPRREAYAGAITDHLWGAPDQIDDATAAVMRIADTERQQAEAAIARVRAECDRIEQDMQGGEDDGMRTALIRVRAALDEPAPVTPAEPDRHIYLSTGCWHGDHDYCKNMTGLNGAKRPASCKKCQARCICPCHHDEAKEEPGPV